MLVQIVSFKLTAHKLFFFFSDPKTYTQNKCHASLVSHHTFELQIFFSLFFELHDLKSVTSKRDDFNCVENFEQHFKKITQTI